MENSYMIGGRRPLPPCPRCGGRLADFSPSGRGEAACDSCHIWWERREDVTGPDDQVRADRRHAEAVIAAAPRIVLEAGVACGRWYPAGPSMGSIWDHLDPRPGCELCIQDVRAVDLRDEGFVPEVSEMAARLGEVVLYRLLPADPGGDRTGGRTKIVLTGAGEGRPAGRAPVNAFLGGWAAGERLVDLSGDPKKGHAEGYVLA